MAESDEQLSTTRRSSPLGEGRSRGRRGQRPGSSEAAGSRRGWCLRRPWCCWGETPLFNAAYNDHVERQAAVGREGLGGHQAQRRLERRLGASADVTTVLKTFENSFSPAVTIMITVQWMRYVFDDLIKNMKFQVLSTLMDRCGWCLRRLQCWGWTPLHSAGIERMQQLKQYPPPHPISSVASRKRATWSNVTRLEIGVGIAAES